MLFSSLEPSRVISTVYQVFPSKVWLFGRTRPAAFGPFGAGHGHG
jgi:hypothetical protein